MRVWLSFAFSVALASQADATQFDSFQTGSALVTLDGTFGQLGGTYGVASSIFGMDVSQGGVTINHWSETLPVEITLSGIGTIDLALSTSLISPSPLLAMTPLFGGGYAVACDSCGPVRYTYTGVYDLRGVVGSFDVSQIGEYGLGIHLGRVRDQVVVTEPNGGGLTQGSSTRVPLFATTVSGFPVQVTTLNGYLYMPMPLTLTDPSPIPEPSAAVLMGAGLLCLWLAGRSSRRGQP